MSFVNRLSNEKSPYLLQHQHNPVDWYAWGKEAFDASRKQNKPIFLSIGYSTCHWCHVMERESFEKEEVAQVLNQHFISIKVDREERPDVDEIYMSAVHAMGMRGGWPLSMFLTPDLKPFYGGTYWPREHFLKILDQLVTIWREQPEKILGSGESLFEFLKTQKSGKTSIEEVSKKIFEEFIRHSLSTFDSRWGGFGPPPKFPHAMQLAMLLRLYAKSPEEKILRMVTFTLEKMARGGIYDHLGGGFARYSTDQEWLTPHFEKMLYDNALLAKVYLEAHQVTKEPMFAEVARETLDYVLRVMTDEKGGFYSAEDADSEGEEGKFYVWRQSELEAILSDEEFELFCRVYGISPSGNFEHHTNILSLQPSYGWEAKQEELLKSSHRKLFEAREKRVHPHKDDKVLTSWNGLMLSAMAAGYQVLGDKKYLKAAKKAADFIRESLYSPQRLLARYRAGESKFNGRLEDYAFLVQGVLDLHQSNFDSGLLKWAFELQELQDKLFWDEESGAYFFTDGSDPSLLVRTQEGSDGALPSGNAVSALNLLRLYSLSSKNAFREKGEEIFKCFSKQLNAYPQAFSQMLMAFDRLTKGGKEVVIVEGSAAGREVELALESIRREFFPHLTLLQIKDGEAFPPLAQGKTAREGKTTFYLCDARGCLEPVFSLDAVWKLLKDES